MRAVRYSGIAFTSERLLGEGAIPRIPVLSGGLSTRRLPFSSHRLPSSGKRSTGSGLPSAPSVECLQLHPHRPDELWSNRTPTPAEIRLGEPALRMLIEAYPKARYHRGGKESGRAVAGDGNPDAGSVRHPANAVRLNSQPAWRG